MLTHWARCKAEALVYSLRNRQAQNRSRHFVTHWPRCEADALVGTRPNRLAEIKMQTISGTVAKVLVEKKVLTERLAKVRFNTLC